LGQFCLQVQADSVSFRLFLNGRELSRELRTPEVSQAASRVAANPQVRQWVQEQLHRLAAEGSIVAEGRDLGSAVFPTASVKFYLDADLAARAARRQQEWQQQATELDMEATMAELARRDQQDKNRAASPLHIPPGAVCLDTTRLTPTEVVGRCLEVIRQGSSSQ
jgi:cytidylate kinase